MHPPSDPPCVPSRIRSLSARPGRHAPSPNGCVRCGPTSSVSTTHPSPVPPPAKTTPSDPPEARLANTNALCNTLRVIRRIIRNNSVYYVV
eukprot:7662792-Pyramimonas_sp.AAC.1